MKKSWNKILAGVLLGMSIFSSSYVYAEEVQQTPSKQVYVTGHKNPDMDSIGSSLGYAALKRAQGVDAVAIRAGAVNKEVAYALQYFKVHTPELVTQIAPKQKIILVDHNEVAHAVDGIETAELVEIVDHHRLGGMLTPNPINVTIRPMGCTGTIVADLYEQNGVEIPKKIAGVLLSAIISDTVLFKSPTCTAHDKAMAEKLAGIAGVDSEAYGMEMLKAGINIDGMTAADIVKNDSKYFDFSGYKAIIATVSTVDNHDLLYKKHELLASMREMCAKEGLDLAFLMIVNIVEGSTDLVCYGEPKELIEKAFGQDASGGSLYLPGVMSRKKQIVPPLTEAAMQLKPAR